MEQAGWPNEYCPEDADEGPPEVFKRQRFSPLDLSDPARHFVSAKTLAFREVDGVLRNFVSDPNKVMPQCVARDPSLDRTYVTDVGQDVIHLYEGWTYKGINCKCVLFGI